MYISTENILILIQEIHYFTLSVNKSYGSTDDLCLRRRLRVGIYTTIENYWAHDIMK